MFQLRTVATYPKYAVREATLVLITSFSQSVIKSRQFKNNFSSEKEKTRKLYEKFRKQQRRKRLEDDAEIKTIQNLRHYTNEMAHL